MAGNRHIDLICALITVLAVVLTVLFVNGEALGLEAVSDGDAGSGAFTANDLDGDWEGAQRITLTGDGATTSGGAYFADGALHIVSAGRYELTGSLTGCVVIETDSAGKVWLRLSGVTIENPDGAAIRVEQAGKVFLTLSEGTENIIRSGAFTDTSAGVDGAIYARDDLTVNGSGRLTVESAGHGIVGNDDLVITGGAITVTAREDGIHANDSVRIRDAELTVNAGDDGVTVSNDENTGYFYMESGALSIPSCFEGVEAQQITVAGGVLDIAPTDDGLNATLTTSAINITGGSVRVVNENGRDADGFDSNGSIYISGGTVFISMSESGGSAALDAGTESGGVCQISGGTVIAAGSGTMASSFDASSPQGFVVSALRGDPGARVTLSGGDGQVLMDETIPCAFSSLILSCPGLVNGDTVTLTVDGTSAEVTAGAASGGLGGFGGMGGGMFGGFGGRGDMAGGRGDMVNGQGDMTGGQGDMTGGRGDMTGGWGGMTGGRGERPGQAAPGQEGAVPGDPGETRSPTQGFGGFTDRPFGSDAAQSAPDGPGTDSPGSTELILTLVSALVLAGGILIAFKVRH